MEIKKTETSFETKWLVMKKATYLTKSGKEMQWDYVSRKNNALVVTVICFDKKSKKYLLIRQPRVPIGKHVIEFPAGLVDQGETPEQAAIREMKEETGYDGKLIRVSPVISKSAGLTDESAVIVEVEVKGAKKGKDAMEETEDIESLWVSVKDFFKLSQNPKYKNDSVDNAVWAFFLGKNK
jgi:ADP-ribose pyrophosphatase